VSAGWDGDISFVFVVELGLRDVVQVPPVLSCTVWIVVRALERNRRRLVDYDLTAGGTDRPVQGNQTEFWTL